jgi:orotate phosphoribosyltransferase
MKLRFKKEDFIDFALNNEVVGFGKVTLKSGRDSYWYANWRKVSNDVYGIGKLADYVINFTLDLEIGPRNFMGVPEGATKLGIVTQYEWARRSKSLGSSNDESKREKTW